MEYIIGGIIKNPKRIVDEAIKFFEKLHNTILGFEGIIENKFFLGLIKEKSPKRVNALFFNDNQIFKSLFYHDLPEILNKFESESQEIRIINELQNDFIYVKYEKGKNIKVYVDKFAREKIYYTITPPFLFCSSLKFLISNIKKKIANYNAITRFLITGVILGKETPLLNINRLDIGEFLYLSERKIRCLRYWHENEDYFLISNQNIRDINYWTEYIYEVFKETLNYQEPKKFLSLMSGGLDSTVITSILSKEFDIPIQTMTIHVPDYNEEEVQKAIEIAEYLNLPHLIKTTKFGDRNIMNTYYSKIFQILEEPMGGSAFLSRYFTFDELSKLDYQNILMGDGAGEVMSYLREFVVANFNIINYLYKFPLKLRKFAMNITNNIYLPLSFLMRFVKNKNIVHSFDIIMRTNFLQSNSLFQSLFTSYQYTNLNNISKITGHNVNFETYLAPVSRNLDSYPFNDYNKMGYNFMINCINSDALIAQNLSTFHNLKLYTPYISDISFKKFLPLPPFLKTLGDRSKWLVREMAKRKKLLPQDYFDWKPKYGLRQIFLTDYSFYFVKKYIMDILNSIKTTSFININPIMNFFKRITLQRILRHSADYMQFNIWFGFIGWLSSIYLDG